MPAYRDLTQADLELRLFHGFLRRQVVTKCRRRVNGAWTVVDAPFVDDWTERDHRALLAQLERTLRLGGFARAAFERGGDEGLCGGGRGVVWRRPGIPRPDQPARLGGRAQAGDRPRAVPCGGAVGAGQGRAKAVHIGPFCNREPGVLPGHGLR